MSQLFDELKRRNVFRVAIAYLVAAWLVLQVADLVLENIEAPDWVMQVFMLIFALGLPIAVIFSWAYELTPEGLKREKEVDRTQSVTNETARKLDMVTIGMLVAVVGFVIVERSFFQDDERGSPDAAATTSESADKSVAVLAFQDLSAEGDQVYFAEGLSEELLNVLAQIPDLQVAGRTSSFAFKGKDTDLREIGEILNVAHILEGSVRKSGNRIRVTAQLINAKDGFHLFSKTYDRDLDDVFAVQDDIAQQISSALTSEIIGTATVQEATPTEIETYELYLEARQKIRTRHADQMAEASRLLDRALAIDPNYAPAMAQKALALRLLSDEIGAYGDIPIEEATAVATPLLERALTIDPDLAEAYAVQGLILPWYPDPGPAIEKLRRAVSLNPNLDDANLWLSSALNIDGRQDEAQALLEKIVERDPLYPPAFNNLIGRYVSTENFDKATSLVDRVARIQPDSSSVSQARGQVALAQGRMADAVRHFRAAYEGDGGSSILRLFYSLALFNIGEFDTVKQVGFPGLSSFAMFLTGEEEAALAVLEQLPMREDDTAFLAARAYGLVEVGEWEKVAELVTTYYGGVDRLIARFDRKNDFGTDYMGPVAFAYRQLGQQDAYEAVRKAMRAALDAQQAIGAAWQPVLQSEIEYAALVGDHDRAFELLQEFLDRNGVNVTIFEGRMMRELRDDPRGAEIKRVMIERANAERAKLGLDSYQRMSTTD